MLTFLGARPEEMGLLAVLGRRRFLTLLLAVGSPSIHLSRAFEYRNPAKILQQHQHNHHIGSSLRPTWRKVIILFEYLPALGALANVATIHWQFGICFITSLNPNVAYIPALWSLFAVTLHLMGVVVFDLRVRRVDGHEEPLPKPSRYPSMRHLTSANIYAWTEENVPTMPSRLWAQTKQNFLALVAKASGVAWSEFWHRSGQVPEERIYIQWLKETDIYVVSAYLLSVFIIIHTIFGTLVLASTTFIGRNDALGIMTRYIASAIVCRVILVYELAVVRECYDKTGTLASEPGVLDENALHNQEEYVVEDLPGPVGAREENFNIRQ